MSVHYGTTVKGLRRGGGPPWPSTVRRRQKTADPLAAGWAKANRFTPTASLGTPRQEGLHLGVHGEIRFRAGESQQLLLHTRPEKTSVYYGGP